jgi:hypothetical protein
MRKNELPRQLRRIITHALEPTSEPTSWQKQMAAIEQRRTTELECLLQTALAKLSHYDDAERDARLQATDTELARLQALLVQR